MDAVVEAASRRFPPFWLRRSGRGLVVDGLRSNRSLGPADGEFASLLRKWRGSNRQRLGRSLALPMLL